MTEAKLEIRPVLAGDASKALSPITRELERFDRRSGQSMTRATRDARRLERAYSGVESGLRRAGGAISGIGRGLLSVQSLAVGAATGLAGRTAVDLLIGSNERLESQRLTFRTLIGDAEKAEKLIQGLRAEAAATPFQEADILEAGKRLLRSTGDNIELNQQLVRQAETLAALNPERTVTDAAEAILDAQLGEFERLKEFSIKLSKAEIDKMKKSGETLGDTAVRAINGRIEKLGAEGLVAELGKSVQGKRSTLTDSFRKLFQEVGEEAFSEVGKGIGELQDELDKLRADPQFREDIREVSALVADASRYAFDLAKNLPASVRAVRDFVSENENALKLGAGLFAANKLTGGGVTNAAFSIGRTALFGRRAGGVEAAADALGGKGSPVYVTNFAEFGGGAGGDFLSRQLSGKAPGAAAGPLTAAELASVKAGSGGGLVGAIGVGGVAAGAVLGASFLLAAKTLVDATTATGNAVKGLSAEVAQGYAAGPRGAKAVAERAQRESQAELRTKRTLGLRGVLDDAFLSGNVDEALGGVKARAAGALQSGASVEDINAELSGFGIEAVKGKRGGVKFRQSGAVKSRLDELTQFDKQLQANPDAAQKLFEEGKLDEVIAEAEGLKAVRDRGAALVDKLNKIDVAKIELNVTVQAAPGESSAQATARAIQQQRATLEKSLLDLTINEQQNRGK